MKLFSAILAVTLLSVSTLAKQIPNDKLNSYKDAVNLALSKAQLVCLFSPAYLKWSDGSNDASMLPKLINHATSATLPDIEDKHILTFTDDFDDRQAQTITITMTPDSLSIVTVELSQFSFSTKTVNVGTIIDPNLVSNIVTTQQASVSCK